MGKKKKSVRSRLRVVRLGRHDLDLDRASSPVVPGVVYEFNFFDLRARDDSRTELRDSRDLETRKETPPTPVAPPTRRCLCLFIVIIGKTPAFDGRRGSKYSNGQWKAQRDFLTLLEDTMDYLFDCLDEACAHVVEVNMDGKPWQKYFAKNADGDSLEYIDSAQKEALVNELRRLYPKWKDDCDWLIFNRIIDDGLAGQRPGTTPMTFEKVAGTDTFKGHSDNYSFIADKAKGFQIAHEIVHQAGKTHSKDNRVPADADGGPDANGSTPGNRRDKNDLMHPVSQPGAKLAAADCENLRQHTRNHKCCDQK